MFNKSFEQVAVKILEKEKIKDKKDVERITREIKILKKVRHPNVIQLYEVIGDYFRNCCFLQPVINITVNIDY